MNNDTRIFFLESLVAQNVLIETCDFCGEFESFEDIKIVFYRNLENKFICPGCFLKERNCIYDFTES